MSKTQISSIFADTISTIKRFPVPIILGFILCVTQIYIARLSIDEIHQYDRDSAALALGACLFISLRLFVDSLQMREVYYYAIGVPLFCLIVWYVTFGQAPYNSIFMMYMGLSLSILSAPFFGSNSDYRKLWTFNYRIFKSICFAALVSFIILTGVFTIAYAAQTLLGINIYEYFYTDTMIIALGFISPMIILSSMNKNISDIFVYPKAVRGLVTYVALPLLYIFGIILLCYGVKIYMDTSMIRGISVSSLYIYLACYGMVVYFLGHPTYSETGVIGFFVRRFFLMLLFPVLFLCLDLYYTIPDVGITNVVYIKLMLFLWFLLSVAFSFLRNAQEVPKFVLTSLALLCIASSFGPWGIAHTPMQLPLKQIAPSTILER
jgi:hypothetical protein